MKASKILSFFFVLTLVLVVFINVRTLEANDQIDEITGEFFSKRVDYEHNNSLVYVFVDGEELKFNIQCDIWQNIVGSGYQGLLIEIKDDITDEIVKSWLILYGDKVDHHFTSELVLTGVYQIIFSALNIDLVDFRWQVENNIPIWIYEISINNLENIYFGIERFAEYYSSIDKMVIELTTQEWTDIEYSVSFGSIDNQIYENFVGNFSFERNIVESLNIEEGLKPHQWYKISFNCPIDKNDSLITFKLFYDHEQLENTARIFFSRGNAELDEIPLDTLHAHPSFLWKKQDAFLPGPYPPSPYNPIDTIKYVLIVAYLFIFTVTFSWVVIRSVKEKKKKDNRSDVASDKYNAIENNTVMYSPETNYVVNFRAVTPEYNLVTDSDVKVTCSICLQVIHNQDIIRCPSCDIAFHKNHLYEWLKMNGKCPACKVKLRIT
jgi:hypothetical protein